MSEFRAVLLQMRALAGLRTEAESHTELMTQLAAELEVLVVGSTLDRRIDGDVRGTPVRLYFDMAEKRWVAFVGKKRVAKKHMYIDALWALRDAVARKITPKVKAAPSSSASDDLARHMDAQFKWKKKNGITW